MKTTVLGLALVAGLVGGHDAVAAIAKVEAPIHQFIDAFDKGDMKTAAATHMASATIIDEFPPHYWTGAGAFNNWATALMADAKANGDTGGKVTLGRVSLEHVEGDKAYVVTSATYSYVEKGAPMSEAGHFTFAMANGASGWKIAAWAWTGSKPMAAKAAVAAKPATAAKPAAKPAGK